MVKTPDVHPGDVVNPPWGNEIRDRTLQVFGSVSERDGTWINPPNGAQAFTTDTGTLWLRTAGVWTQRTGLFSAGAFASGDIVFSGPGVGKNLATFNLPAMPFATTVLVTCTYFAGFGTVATTFHAALAIGGAQLIGKTQSAATGVWVSGAMTHGAGVAANVAAVITADMAYDSGANGYANASTTWYRLGPQ